MAVITARTSPLPSVSTPYITPSNQNGSGLICGENITAGDACYIASDGLVYKSGGSGVTAVANAGAAVHGFAAESALLAQNDPVTLLTEVDLGYTAAAGLTPGAKLYIDCSTATKGRLGDARPFVGVPPCAYAVDATRIRVFRSLPIALS